MKYKIILILLLVFSLSVSSQVFNPAPTLGKRTFSLGFEPLIYGAGNENNFIMFFHGALKLKSDLDLRLMYGSEDYFGAALKFKLAKAVSITTGGHMFGNFGLDGMLNLSIPLKGGSYIFTGFDVDLDFPDDIVLRPWIPIGIEVSINNGVSVILEGEIGLNNSAPHIFGGGIAVYL